MEIVRQIAKMIDHALLHPTLTDADIEQGCALAARYGVASVCVKPYAVAQAAQWLQHTDVQVGTVIGFPHGSNTVGIKVAETHQACLDGATEIDVVLNIGKALAHDWQYLHHEIAAIKAACQTHGALLKVIFETDMLPDDDVKIKLCELCTDCEVGFVKTSTGFGFVKQADGTLGTQGATEHDVSLMRQYAGPQVQVKASGGIRSLDDALRFRALGATRLGTSATVAIVEEAYRRYAPQKASEYTLSNSPNGY